MTARCDKAGHAPFSPLPNPLAAILDTPGVGLTAFQSLDDTILLSLAGAKALQLFPALRDAPALQVIELCLGSGLALVHVVQRVRAEERGATGVGMEIDAAACTIATGNAEAVLGPAAITILDPGDVTTVPWADSVPAAPGAARLVLMNPPYITVPADLAREFPVVNGGPDGCDFYSAHVTRQLARLDGPPVVALFSSASNVAAWLRWVRDAGYHLHALHGCVTPLGPYTSKLVLHLQSMRDSPAGWFLCCELPIVRTYHTAAPLQVLLALTLSRAVPPVPLAPERLLGALAAFRAQGPPALEGLATHHAVVIYLTCAREQAKLEALARALAPRLPVVDAP